MAMIKRLSVWMSAVACLAVVTDARAAEPDYVWWEGEATTETNFPKQSGFSANTFANIRSEILSEGDWLTNGENRAPGEAEPFAKYRVTVPADGTYQLYTRKFWKHGPFRWRFGEGEGEGEWQTCGGDVALLDSTPIRQFLEANWVRLGEVKLNAGEQTFELRLLAKEGQGKGAAFDAFVLMQSPFVPRGKLKPDSKSGQAADGFWAFEPDADTFEHKDLDLRSLNEAQAGISGHVRREGGHFVLADGRPARFWAVQAGAMELDNASVDFLARRLAKAGVNLVRMEANIRDGSSADPMAVSREKLDRLHYVIASLKREGIYTYLGHNFWGTSFTAKDSYGIAGFHDGDKGAALLIFSPRMQEIYKAWAKAQLTTVNPYTGVPLAKEPALAVYEIQNEDSYFWWSFDWNLKDPEKLASLELEYGKWLTQRYGTLEKALAAWGQRDNRDRPQQRRTAFLQQCNFKGSAALQVQALDELRKKEVPAGGVLAGQSVPAIDPLAFYVGRVERSFAAKPDEAMARELSPFINRQAKTIRSVTDELYWDYGQGFITLKTPRSQGVAGFVAKAGRVDLGDVVIESGNDYAVIVVVALDDQPLASSQRILIQAMTDDQFYGWKTEPQAKGQKIVSLGGYPLNVRKIDAKVTFKNNAGARRAMVLDGNANPTEQTAALNRDGSSVTLSLPADAIYTIIDPVTTLLESSTAG